MFDNLAEEKTANHFNNRELDNKAFVMAFMNWDSISLVVLLAFMFSKVGIFITFVSSGSVPCSLIYRTITLCDEQTICGNRVSERMRQPHQYVFIGDDAYVLE